LKHSCWALLPAVLTLALAGCGGGGEEPTATPTASSTPTQAASPKVAGKDCGEAGELAAEPERQPPADMAVLSYAHLYRSEGDRFYAALDGTPAELASRRDDAQNELVQNWGFASLRTDDKPGVESEAHLKGPKHTVDIRVTPLCDGKIGIRYTVK
jgi:Flp pilus assembly protein TadD